MTLITRAVPAIAAGMLFLTACGQGAETSRANSATPSVAATGDKQFDATMNCWALTSTSYFLHMALPGETGNLPNADETIYTVWAKHLAVMAFDKGMGFQEFQDLKNEVKGSVRVHSLQVEPDYAAAVQKCIDTTPPPSNEADPSWPN